MFEIFIWNLIWTFLKRNSEKLQRYDNVRIEKNSIFSWNTILNFAMKSFLFNIMPRKPHICFVRFNGRLSISKRDYVARSLRRQIYVFVFAAVDEGMHFQVIIIAETVRGLRFGPTPSRSQGRRLSALIVQPIDAAWSELSLPFEELLCLHFIFYDRKLARASRKFVIRPICTLLFLF